MCIDINKLSLVLVTLKVFDSGKENTNTEPENKWASLIPTFLEINYIKPEICV